ncbi:MAG TPA: hypothetical protein VFG30_00760 [Polyangiales bacterium]|nr:hypothetical protein [Polyangiales bacterium]
MLQVLFSATTQPCELTEDEFLARVDCWVADGFAQVPSGPVSVQDVDLLDRVSWRAYYPSAAALVKLAREIREGRAAMRSRARRNGHV